MTKFALVGDVGGTNARLALCDIASGDISRAKTYSGLDYPSLEAVVRVYLDEQGVEVEDGCIAIACPITGDWVAMTNHTWAFSIAEMKKNLGFSHLEIINDSAHHAGHAGHDGSGESHFTILIESAAFSGLNRLARQRAVNAALGDIPGGRVHALAIKASAPDD
jgi:glucokinase